jgi:hypothetical protein
MASRSDKPILAVIFFGLALITYWLVPLSTTDPKSAATAYGDVPLAIGDGRYLTPLGIALLVMPTLLGVLASPFIAGGLVSLVIGRLGPEMRAVVFGLFGIVCGITAAVLRLLLLQ